MDKIFGALIVQRRIYFISKDLIFYPGFVLNKPQIYQIAGFIAGTGLFWITEFIWHISKIYDEQELSKIYFRHFD